MDNTIIKRFLFVSGEEANVFVCGFRSSPNAIIIDAGGFSPDIMEYVSTFRLQPKMLFITHNHYDHVDEVSQYLEHFPELTVYALDDLPDIETVKPDDGEIIGQNNLRGKVHHLPGHTKDLMGLYINGHLFTGDALFAGSVGGTQDEQDYFLQIQGIRNKLLRYPNETVIHPGHGPDSTIELEKLFNPFLS